MPDKRISRRDFLGTGVAAPLMLPWSVQAQSAAEGVGRLRITKVEAGPFPRELADSGPRAELDVGAAAYR